MNKFTSRKILSVLLVLVMVLSIAPSTIASVFAIEQDESQTEDTTTQDSQTQETSGPLTFKATQAGSTVTFGWLEGSSVQVKASSSSVKIGGSDATGNWQDYGEGTVITLTNVGDTVSFRAQNIKTNSSRHFEMTGKIEASGAVTSLTNNIGGDEALTTEYCYSYMFYECEALTTAPSLPSTTLSSHCYEGMFEYCSLLTTAPSLPATTLADSCYREMFDDCSSLTTAPSLPATTLAQYCYYGMFSDCASLTAAPSLPATTLADYCYDLMFRYCTSLTTAPSLPATTLTQYCYYGMFEYCSLLTTAPSLPATTLADHCYESMFLNCASLTTAPSLPATTLANSCYKYMFYNCISLTTAPSLPATTLTEECYYGMFKCCGALTTAPSLLATTLATRCYVDMFIECSNLKIVETSNSSEATWIMPDVPDSVGFWNGDMVGTNAEGSVTSIEKNKMYKVSANTSKKTVPTKDWVTDSNNLMEYASYGDADYAVRGFVDNLWRTSNYDDESYHPYAYGSDNVSVISCTPTFISDGQAIELVYTVQNTGSSDESFVFTIWADTMVNDNDGSLNATSADRSILTMTCLAKTGEKLSTQDIVFYALSTEDSGVQFKCAAYSGSGTGVDPAEYTEVTETSDSAMYAYWPSATLAAGETAEYHLIVGMTDGDSLDDVINNITGNKSTPTADSFEYDSTTGVVSAASGEDLGTVTTYYKVNGSWTTTKPTTAGNYEVGVVTTGSDTYEAVGSASEPFTSDWSYSVANAPTTNNGDVKIAEDKQSENFGSGELADSVNELKDVVLTDEDKAAVEAGKDVNIWVEVKDISSTVSDEDKEAIEDNLPDGYTLGMYLDISLWKQIEGNDAVKVTETSNGKVKIRFQIPEELQKEGVVYKIIRLHDGVVTVIDAEVDSDFYLTFETDKFSTYALAYENVETTVDKAPNTNDESTQYIGAYLLIASIGALGFAVTKRIKEYDELKTN